MSDSSAFGFAKFIPGFDFLQNVAKPAPSTGLPPFSHWVAPTLSVEDIEKRIEELKAVQFWLEQNSKALAATVQALEVQRMTLSTLKEMNVNLADLAKAFPFAQGVSAASEPRNPFADWPLSANTDKPAGMEPPAQAATAPQAGATPDPEPVQSPDPSEAATAEPQANHMATAMQWWGALTQQFQHIAQKALQEPAQQQAMAQATQMTTDFAKTAMKAASDMVKQATAPTAQTADEPAPAASSKKASATHSPQQPKRTPATKAAAKTRTKAPAAASGGAKKAVLSDKKGTSVSAPAKRRSTKQS